MTKRLELRSLLSDQRGATAIEYGLICAMIVLAMLAALRGVARANTEQWNLIADQVTNAS